MQVRIEIKISIPLMRLSPRNIQRVPPVKKILYRSKKKNVSFKLRVRYKKVRTFNLEFDEKRFKEM